MKNIFQKIPVELPNPLIHKEKYQSLLHDIRGGQYVKKLNDKLPHLKKRKLSKKSQKRRMK